jgi:methylthioribose-1-phosphate isomerase
MNKVVETLKWIGEADGSLELIDQRKLPGSFEKLQCTTIEQLHEAIKTLAVRGAPAIGVAAGYGICLAMQKLKSNTSIPEALSSLTDAADYLASSRPTAVNLFWALDRMKKGAKEFAAESSNVSVIHLKEHLLNEAHRICEEDKQMCKAIGLNGSKFIEDGFSVLTHCNAGALATAGQGTALSVIYEAHKQGKKIRVYTDETRPLLQGARLTAWELSRAGIETALICDNMAGMLLKEGKINAIITGADRIAANGDAANKIGTFSLSILAKEHHVPFYIAAPSSTFDLNIKTGTEIPIEQRKAEEVTSFAGTAIAPDGINVYNPAFDVTDAACIAAIITEKGVIEKPNAQKIAAHFAR